MNRAPLTKCVLYHRASSQSNTAFVTTSKVYNHANSYFLVKAGSPCTVTNISRAGTYTNMSFCVNLCDISFTQLFSHIVTQLITFEKSISKLDFKNNQTSRWLSWEPPKDAVYSTLILYHINFTDLYSHKNKRACSHPPCI